MQNTLNKKGHLELLEKIIKETGGIFEINNDGTMLITFPNQNYKNTFINKSNYHFTTYNVGDAYCLYTNDSGSSLVKILITPFIIVNECIITKEMFIEYIQRNLTNSDTIIKLSDAFDSLGIYCRYYIDCNTYGITAEAFRILFKKLNNLRNETCKIKGGCLFKDSKMAILTNMLMSLLTCFPNFTGYIEFIDEKFVHRIGDEKIELSSTFISASLMVSLDYLGFISEDLIRDNLFIKLISDKKIVTKGLRWSYENALKFRRSHRFICIKPNKNVNVLMNDALRMWDKDKTIIYSIIHRIAGTPALISSELKYVGLDDDKIQEIINDAISFDNYQTTKKAEYLNEINASKESKMEFKNTTDMLNSKDKDECCVYSPTHRIAGSPNLVSSALKNAGLDNKIQEIINNSISVDNYQTNNIEIKNTSEVKDNSNKLSDEEMIRIFDIGLVTIRKQFIENLAK